MGRGTALRISFLATLDALCVQGSIPIIPWRSQVSKFGFLKMVQLSLQLLV